MNWSLRKPRPTYANVVATMALVIAVAGTGAPGAVAAAVKKLAPNAVATRNIRDGAVTGAKVADRTLTASDVARGSLGGAEIKDGSLGGGDIADHSLGSQDLGNGQIFDQNLATGSVNSRVVQDNSLTSDDLADDSVGTNDIANNAIKGEDISPNTIPLSRFDPAAIASLTHMWDTDPIAAGSTITGYSGIAYVAGEDPGPTPEIRSLAISFPASVTGITEVDIAPTADCTGSFEAPSSAAGRLCIYPRAANPGDHAGTFERLDFSNFGALLKYTPPATGWTYAQLSWAFTRP